MGKYAEAIGMWEHKLGKIEHKLKPKKADNLEVTKIMTASEQNKNFSQFLFGLGELYKKMVLREYPDISEEDKTELDEWIGVNINQIGKDLLVAFRWAKKEEIENIFSMGEDLKKLNPQLQSKTE